MTDELDKKIIRVLQKGIPLTSAPYAAMAAEIGIPVETFMSRLRSLKERGILRRLGGVLQHRHAGFVANALCVWQLPEETLDNLGSALSKEPFVTHCYTRLVAEGWPYNFYVMIHARDRAACEKLAERIEREHHLSGRRMFYSVREWKKALIKYFID